MSNCNIILIGMPGSGKSTIGRAVANQLGRLFIDVDDVIVRHANRSIPEIFAQEGERYFRQLEAAALAECCARQECVIATGGGAILSPVNRELLRASGLVCQLSRKLESLELQAGRPLSTDIEALIAMSRNRLPLYEATRHILIDNNGAPEDAVNAILGAYHEISRH